VKTEFHEYFDCSEYDGKETGVFDLKELQIQETKRILKENQLTAEEKLQEIQTIFDNYIPANQLIIGFKTAMGMFAEDNKLN
jgi:hypothetical protein